MENSSVRSMTVSVIIPTYNYARFVANAIDSALNQTRPPHEIIVVDDGSTDNTPEVLGQFGPPVISLRQKNGGVSTARNLGLRTATGDAVIFLDSDDLLVPTCVEHMVRVLEENPEVAGVYSDFSLVDPSLKTIGICSQIMPGPRPSGMILGEVGCRSIMPVTTMVRTSVLDGALFDETMKYGEDWEFLSRVAAKGQYRYVDEPLLRYRHHDSMATSRVSESLDGEIEVQRRIIAMPEFKRLPGHEQAKVLCSHGVRHAMRDRCGVARGMFWRAIQVAPTYAAGHVLFGLSLLGLKPLQYAILKRRQVIGHTFDDVAGAQKGNATGAVRHPAPARDDSELFEPVGAQEASQG